MIILDPDNPSSVKRCSPPAAIPDYVRTFGKLPNVDDWLPGDLILVSATSPNQIQKAIERVQIKGGYAAEHARWHHAAVYLGDYGICEATRSGVKADKICNYSA